MQRGVQRGLISAGAGVKPVALQHAVVQRRVGVLVVGVGLMERAIRGGAILLAPIRLEQRPVLTVGQRDLVAAGQRDRRKLHVRRRQRRVAVVRHAAEAAGKREQPLAFLVEHVLLLVKQALDRKAIDGEFGVPVHPAANRVERNRQQLRVEPRARLLLPGEQDLHLLAAAVDLVVALILVVLQRREVPDLVREGAHLVHRRERVEQRRPALETSVP